MRNSKDQRAGHCQKVWSLIKICLYEVLKKYLSKKVSLYLSYSKVWWMDITENEYNEHYPVYALAIYKEQHENHAV